MTTNKEAGDRQTALVTGASAGIGVDLAECFARDGYDVIVFVAAAVPFLPRATLLGIVRNLQSPL